MNVLMAKDSLLALFFKVPPVLLTTKYVRNFTHGTNFLNKHFPY